MKTQNHDRLGDKMTFRAVLTGCWMAAVVIILVGVSYLHAAGKFQWLPVVVKFALAVCVPIIGFSVGLAIDRRFRHEEY